MVKSSRSRGRKKRVYESEKIEKNKSMSKTIIIEFRDRSLGVICERYIIIFFFDGITTCGHPSKYYQPRLPCVFRSPSIIENR